MNTLAARILAPLRVENRIAGIRPARFLLFAAAGAVAHTVARRRWNES